MSISSSLNAGVAGLAANSVKLSAISDNIANSSTYGYKRANTEFDSLVISQTKGSYSAGGVIANTSRLVSDSGTLVSSSNALDLAVSGRGFLPVTSATAVDNETSDQPLMMTTTGAFRTDADGVLRTESGLVLLGWPASADGTIPVYPRDSTAGLQPIVINPNQTAGDPTTEMSLGVNLPAVDTAYDATGESLPLSVEYFGNLGTSETLAITFTPSIPTTGSSNEWTIELRDSAIDTTSDPDANIIGTYTLTFDETRENGGTLADVVRTSTNGTDWDASTGIITVEVEGGPIEVNLGRQFDTNGLTQLSDSFSPSAVTRDGSPVGSLTTVEVDADGFVKATYDTGFVRTIYQIPMVDVPNANGLTAMDSQTFQVSGSSGSFFLWDAGEGPTGSIEGYARQGSSVDVAQELTDLIQTQRAYSSNAKVIQTVDEMLQETTNIKR
ncbi:flagellar biosynthesis protein FlgE [Thioclava sp. SK-1]|uniref:flagellar hook protein FlgE n=1 Tax=Thioclava sp. SK-1 TaxID=1889770 RepID=UPI000825060A|nr:flagellar hook-basal body complex protein [Thioclava sp. SK-1]OCX65285.1 flagellar biosynthesis protein FlgE [Thioclava sp. SK-1]